MWQINVMKWKAYGCSEIILFCYSIFNQMYLIKEMKKEEKITLVTLS